MGLKNKFFYLLLGCLAKILGCGNVALFLPCFCPMKRPDFVTDFWLEKEGVWTSVLHGNCICNCELDVRILNYPNWTFIAQVMVHFPGLPQVVLF